MEKRRFGNTDMEFSVLGFGGVEIGYNANQTQQDVDELLNSALDSGLNVLDTASAYKTSEEMIGKAVGKRRKDYFLLTKCGALEGFTRYDWSKKGVLETIVQSLRKLQTDHLDIAQLHSPSAEILRQGDCIEGLERAVEKGYTRYIGYSGDNADAEYAIAMDVFDSLQISVSIRDQSPIDGNIPAAVGKGLGVIAKRPIANAVWRYEEKPEDPYVQPYWDRMKKLRYEFFERTAGEAAATALKFALAIPGVDTMIVGTSRPQRWQENARHIAKGPLSIEEYESIRDRWREVADESWKGEN